MYRRSQRRTALTAALADAPTKDVMEVYRPVVDDLDVSVWPAIFQMTPGTEVQLPDREVSSWLYYFCKAGSGLQRRIRRRTDQYLQTAGAAVELSTPEATCLLSVPGAARECARPTLDLPRTFLGIGMLLWQICCMEIESVPRTAAHSPE